MCGSIPTGTLFMRIEEKIIVTVIILLGVLVIDTINIIVQNIMNIKDNNE